MPDLILSQDLLAVVTGGIVGGAVLHVVALIAAIYAFDEANTDRSLRSSEILVWFGWLASVLPGLTNGLWVEHVDSGQLTVCLFAPVFLNLIAWLFFLYYASESKGALTAPWCRSGVGIMLFMALAVVSMMGHGWLWIETMICYFGA